MFENDIYVSPIYWNMLWLFFFTCCRILLLKTMMMIPIHVDSYRCNVIIVLDVELLFRYMIASLMMFPDICFIYVDQTVLLLLPKYIFKFQSFIFECDNLLKNRTAVCTDRCKNTLIGLTSTVEGRKLMNVSIL